MCGIWKAADDRRLLRPSDLADYVNTLAIAARLGMKYIEGDDHGLPSIYGSFVLPIGKQEIAGTYCCQVDLENVDRDYRMGEGFQINGI